MNQTALGTRRGNQQAVALPPFFCRMLYNIEKYFTWIVVTYQIIHLYLGRNEASYNLKATMQPSSVKITFLKLVFHVFVANIFNSTYLHMGGIGVLFTTGLQSNVVVMTYALGNVKNNIQVITPIVNFSMCWIFLYTLIQSLVDIICLLLCSYYSCNNCWNSGGICVGTNAITWSRWLENSSCTHGQTYWRR